MGKIIASLFKQKLLSMAGKLVMGAIALGIGIWYISSSIGGQSLTYTNPNQFLHAIGTNGDISTANGCFLCSYIQDLFGVVSSATEKFWNLIVENLWIVMVIGFGIFLFFHTGQQVFKAMQQTAKLDDGDKKLEIKEWFDKVWRQAARVMIVGALIGVVGMGGTDALKTIANIIITPVLFIGAQLSMAATGIISSATCGAGLEINGDILSSISQPFMCVMGNLNSVMLAGASGGFALMNYAWMGLGGGVLTWVAGLAMVIMFLIIGFNLFFQVLSVIFKLVFLIIFLPILLAAYAFEPVWKAASGLTGKAVGMVIDSAVKIIAITLKILILYGVVAFAADMHFPGPQDGYSSILPPLLEQTDEQRQDATTQSVMHVFSLCEEESLDSDGVVDGDKFKICFERERVIVERVHPHAFDFMKNGWDFFLLVLGIFVLYYFAIDPKIDDLLNGKAKNGGETFDFGGNVKTFGKKLWSYPEQIYNTILKKVGKKD